VSYRNPLPVAVLVLPVEKRGLLMVRRATPPIGLAFPSGFIEYGERWQDAAARELAEEAGVRVDPDLIRELCVRTGCDGMLLVFATAPAVSRAALQAFLADWVPSLRALRRGPAGRILRWAVDVDPLSI